MNIDPSEARWFKSSRSAGASECVEVAHLNHNHVGVRDSKNPAGPALIFAPAEWDSFTTALQNGGFEQ
ncbi:DUF397 domain-containing protein [Nocardia cyriacigeorgica]|nr:DUF397 domain-containing protein [Nocardia cyriacigeorgica]